MACLQKTEIDAFVTGLLSEDESRRVRGHLIECAGCRSEAGLGTAIRLSWPKPSDQSACPDDEVLALMVDEVLTEPEREQFLQHAFSCDRCMTSWLALIRSVDEAEEPELEAPAHLREKAIAMGSAQTESSGWLAKWISRPPMRQWLLAGAATAAALWLVVMFFTPSVDTPALPTPPVIPQVAEHQPPEPDQAVPSAKPTTPLSTTASAETKRPPQPRPDKPESIWKSFLSQTQGSPRQKMLAKIQSSLRGGGPGMARALNQTQLPPLATEYRLGGLLEMLRSATRIPGGSLAVHPQMTEALRSISVLLHSSESVADSKLSQFAEKLAQESLSKTVSKQSLRRRIGVLITALGERGQKTPSARTGLQLGQVSSRLSLLAVSLQSGHPPPEPAWPSRSALKKLLAQVESTQSTDLAELTKSLPQLAEIGRGSKRPEDGTRILSELDRLNANLRLPW